MKWQCWVPLWRHRERSVSLSLLPGPDPPYWDHQEIINWQIFLSNFEAFKRVECEPMPCDMTACYANLIIITPQGLYFTEMMENFENKLVISVGAVSLCYSTAWLREAPSHWQLNFQFLSLFLILRGLTASYFCSAQPSASFPNQSGCVGWEWASQITL